MISAFRMLRQEDEAFKSKPGKTVSQKNASKEVSKQSIISCVSLHLLGNDIVLLESSKRRWRPSTHPALCELSHPVRKQRLRICVSVSMTVFQATNLAALASKFPKCIE